MQIGITQIIHHGTLEQFFDLAEEAGYEVVELALSRDGELNPDLSPEEAKHVLEMATSRGLEIVSLCHLHCSGNLLDSGDAQKRSIEETIAGLRLARELGVGCTLHTLGSLRADLYYDDAYRNAVASLKEIAVACAEFDVSLAVEFVWNGFLFSPLEMRNFLDEINSPFIGFYFDPGNMAVFNFPQHWVRITAAHLKMVHLKDWKGKALSGEWTPLLEGEVDFPAIMRELRDAGYDGSLISEVELTDASAADTAAAIRRIIEL